jgi:hypothetical protein
MNCCDNPVFAGPCPDTKGDTIAKCGTCGAEHGKMKLAKAEALFSKPKEKANARGSG